MSTVKPDLTRIWASSAPPSNIVDPDTTTPGKVAAGWVAEVPPFEHFNFLQQWFTQGLAHFNEQGLGIWDANTIYPAGAVAKGSNGKLYTAVHEQAGNDPTVDTGANWYAKYLTALVDDFAACRELPSAQLSDGERVTIGDQATLFAVKTGAVVDDNDTLIVFTDDLNRYVEKLVVAPIVPGVNTITLPMMTDNSVGASEIITGSVGQSELGANCAGQSELKLATANTSHTVGPNGFLDVSLTGGLYSLHAYYGGGAAAWVDFNSRSFVHAGTYASVIRPYNTANSNQVFYVQNGYVQGSPPHKVGGYNIPLFVTAMIEKGTGKILHTSVAEDPSWTNNGPHDMHNLGKQQRFLGTWGENPLSILKSEKRREEVAAKRKEWDTLLDDERNIILKAPWSMDEKNIDMDVVPHLFLDFDPSKHEIVMVDPANPLLEDLFHYRKAWEVEKSQGDSINELLLSGQLLFDKKTDVRGPRDVNVYKLKTKFTKGK